jgi:hypothetical protein
MASIIPPGCADHAHANFRSQVLYMHGNQIANMHDVLKLAKLESLQKLTLHGNPIAEAKNYKMWCGHAGSRGAYELEV